jgi:hypothetical protein
VDSSSRQDVSRIANDRIYNVLWGFAAVDGAFVCECRGSSCAVEVTMTPLEYVHLRDRGELVYAPGHGATPPAVSVELPA